MARPISLRLLVLAALLSLAAGSRPPVEERRLAGLDSVPDIALQSLATGIGPITSIANAGDSRLFLTLQTGRIVIWSGGQIQAAPFLDLSALIACCVERGLLGLAFHPQFASNRFFFVDY